MKCSLRYTYLLLFLLCSSLAFSQSQRSARNLVVQGKIQEAIVEYAQVSAKEPGNTTVLMEYAYALSLGGMTEVALMHIDRANLLGGGADFPFYASQVLLLAGLDSLAAEFWTGDEKAPGWIAPYHRKFYEQHEQQFDFKMFDADSAYSRANQLADKGMFLQAIVLYEDVKFFVEGYTNEFLPYISSSVAWEKLGKYGKAARELSISMELMRQETAETPDSAIISALPAFTNHLQLLQKQATIKQSFFKKLVDEYHPQTMLYVGGMYSSSFYSLNSRFGVFLSNSWNAGADLGVSGSKGGSTFVNLGLSAYGRWKFLVGGAGFSSQFGESTALNFRLTSGVSFFNKKKSRSFDVFFNIDIPLQKESVTTWGISIGRSLYFGKRNEKGGSK